MDKLKAVFAHSADKVIITDYNFNILWSNNESDLFSLYGKNCSELFVDEALPLRSGVYYAKHNGMYYECRIINYPDYEDGIYVIQTSGEDVMYSFANCKGVKEVLVNQSGLTREAVTGINFSNEHLRCFINKQGSCSEYKYIDIIAGNCCKLLKSSINILELINYTDETVKIHRINLSSALEFILNKSEDILDEKIQIKHNIEPELFIKADFERLLHCVLSLIVLTNDSNPENNIITISAVNSGDYISLTFSADSAGIDLTEKKFTNHTNLYTGDEVNTDMFIVNRFCKVFGGTLFVSENTEKNRIFSIKLPADNSSEEAYELNTSSKDYKGNIFSKYHIVFSDILF